MEKNIFGELIRALIKGIDSGKNMVVTTINGHKIVIHGSKYLLNQMLRQYELSDDHYCVSKAAENYWHKVLGIKIPITKFGYCEKITLNGQKTFDKYVGSSKNPKSVTQNWFCYNDIFHNEHIVPIGTIIKELLKTYRNGELTDKAIYSILDKIYIARILKKEDRTLQNKRDGDNALNIINNEYKKAGIDIDWNYKLENFVTGESLQNETKINSKGLIQKHETFCRQKENKDKILDTSDVWSKVKFIIIKTSEEQINRTGNLYDAVRKEWKCNINRAAEYPYVLGVVNKIVQEVYKVDKWYLSNRENHRYAFEGKVASNEIRKLYINKQIPIKFRKKGNRCPLLYSDKE